MTSDSSMESRETAAFLCARLLLVQEFFAPLLALQADEPDWMRCIADAHPDEVVDLLINSSPEEERAFLRSVSNHLEWVLGQQLPYHDAFLGWFVLQVEHQSMLYMGPWLEQQCAAWERLPFFDGAHGGYQYLQDILVEARYFGVIPRIAHVSNEPLTGWHTGFRSRRPYLPR